MPALENHEKVRGFLLDRLHRSDTTLVITPSIMHEFVQVVTDGRRFDPPVEMSEALAVAKLYLERHRLGRKRRPQRDRSPIELAAQKATIYPYLISL